MCICIISIFAILWHADNNNINAHKSKSDDDKQVESWMDGDWNENRKSLNDNEAGFEDLCEIFFFAEKLKVWNNLRL